MTIGPIVISLSMLMLSCGWCTLGARNMLSLAMARLTVLLTYKSGGILQFRVPYLKIHFYNKTGEKRYHTFYKQFWRRPPLPRLSRFGDTV